VSAAVLVVSAEPVGALMAGPAIRAAELARALAGVCPVTLAAPAPSRPPDPRVELLEAGPADVGALLRAARGHEVVLAQELPPTLLERIARSPTRLVVDLYNPVVVEVLEAVSARSPRAQRRIQGAIVTRTLAQLAAADFIVCASERQRDLWLGALALRGLIDLDHYRRDPALRSLFAVVPGGIPGEPPPAPGEPVLRRAFPRVEPGDRVLLWAGGIWSWLDARTPIAAVELLEERGGPPTHLVFLGTGRPGLAATGQARFAHEAVEEARRRGLEGRRVHFNPGWVPYAERGRWLVEADVGVSAHLDHLEARFSHRTRVLDYLWAGLPVVVTRGDALADLVERERLGRTVAPGDSAGFADACAALLDSGGERDEACERIAALAPSLRWERVAGPLLDYCATVRERPRRPVSARAVRVAALAHYRRALLLTIEERGPAEAARRVARRLWRAAALR
jgi:glycosyltransferase involved in cell wall biosynthesis